MRRLAHLWGKQFEFRSWGFYALGCLLTFGLGLMPWGGTTAYAGESPQKGGIVVWAVHESMPTFDMHHDTSYILAQPVAPLYNGLVTQDPYNEGKIIGDLAERWEIA